MPRLSSQRALPRFAAAVGKLYDAAATNTPEELAQVSARTVAELISCDGSSYNHLVTSGGYAQAPLFIAHYPTPPSTELLAAFEAHMDKHVSFRVVQQRGIEDAVSMSDFMSNREFRRTGFYQEYYRHRGTRFQLGFAFAASATSSITVALNRWLRDFSADERALLTLLRPHFQRAYEFALARWLCQEDGDNSHAAAAALRAPSLTPTGSGGARPRSAWVRVTPDGRLRDCPTLLRDWLENYGFVGSGDYGRVPRRGRGGGDFLPDTLRRWWRDRAAPRTDTLPKLGPALVLENNDGHRLVARMLRTPASSKGCSTATGVVDGLLHFEEEPAIDHAAALRALGLTPRQAEVLLWVAHGKTNEEVGVILGASPHTVHHHVEAILARLGVVSRAEATLRALESLGWLRWPQPPLASRRIVL